MKRYYFDYAAATPVDARVEKAMRPYLGKVYGNPGALHWFGQEASAAVFEARQKISQILGCHYKEIIFTSGATESNNIALRGITRNYTQNYAEIFRVSPRKVSVVPRPRIIISAVEHESILETCKELKKEGAEIVYLPVDKKGRADLKKMKKMLDERTVLVSVMYANNEIGTIQPILEINKIISDFRKNSQYPLFHTDAAQALNYLDCNVQRLGVDLMTLSSQKIYGPKGVGLLYVKSHKSKVISPIVTGGGQEFGIRGGTENVPGIVGFAKAMELAIGMRELESKRLKKLREYFWNRVQKIASKTKLNGGLENSLPNILNLYFSGNHGQDLLIKLDLAGFAVSSGAACSARICQPSHVLKALGCSDEQAAGSLRISFGRLTNKVEIDKLLEVLKIIVLY